MSLFLVLLAAGDGKRLKSIYPKKKPIKIKNTQEITEVVDDTKDNTFIYPKKKPILVQKKVDKIIAKSKILSKKDFKIAVAAFEAIDKKKWKTALKLSKKSRDKNLYRLVNYLYLIKTINGASFYDYTAFINSNSNYPRINRLKYLAEHKINLKNNSPTSIMKWFDGNASLSEFGKIKLGEAYLALGDMENGSKLIKEGCNKAK